MKCWNCRDIDLIWGGDDDHINEDGEAEIITNLSCPACEALVFFHHGSRNPNVPEWVEDMGLDLH